MLARLTHAAVAPSLSMPVVLSRGLVRSALTPGSMPFVSRGMLSASMAVLKNPACVQSGSFADRFARFSQLPDHASLGLSRNFSGMAFVASGRRQDASWRKQSPTPRLLPLHLKSKCNHGLSESNPSRGLVSMPLGDETKERLKTVMQEYGKVVLLSHSVVWAGSLAVTWAALNAMDLTSFIMMLPESIASHVDPSAGAFAIAFVLVKLTGPVRLMFDIAITPTLAGYLRGTWLAGPLGLRKLEVAEGGKGGKDSYHALMRLAVPGARRGRDRVVAWSGQAVRAVKAKFAVLRSKRKFALRGRESKEGGGGPGGVGAVVVPKQLQWTLKEHNALLKARRRHPPRRSSSHHPTLAQP